MLFYVVGVLKGPELMHAQPTATGTMRLHQSGIVKNLLIRGDVHQLFARGPPDGCTPHLHRICQCATVSASAPDLATQPAEAGSVKEHNHHILLRVAPNAATDTGNMGGLWWPSIVEKHPAVVQAFRAVAAHQGALQDAAGPKISMWEGLKPLRPPASDHCDAMIFPAGVRYTNLPLSLLPAVVAHNIFDGRGKLPLEAKDAQVSIASLLTLLVCCHGARDARCGALGPPLAAALAAEIHRRGLSQQCQVLQVSHIGGHKFAGNVVTYMARHPADGDWFGGLTASDAGDFIDALVSIEVGVDGGAEDGRLRPWWRGRMGLSKTEQRDLFAVGGDIGEVEDGVLAREEVHASGCKAADGGECGCS